MSRPTLRRREGASQSVRTRAGERGSFLRPPAKDVDDRIVRRQNRPRMIGAARSHDNRRRRRITTHFERRGLQIGLRRASRS